METPSTIDLMDLADDVSICVVGCGGIGGTIAAHLAEAGYEVDAISRNKAIVSAVQSKGFRLCGIGGARDVPGKVYEQVPGRDTKKKYDIVVLATQPQQVEAAARSLTPHLSKEATVVVVQNGLCESRVATIVGKERVAGGIVSWGASMPEPGVFERTALGSFTLGRLGGSPDSKLRLLGQILETVAPVGYTSNLIGARFSKLAMNCAISTLGTIAGERLGPLLRSRRVRRLALEIMTEAVGVARSENIRLEKLSGTIDLQWVALTDQEKTRNIKAKARATLAAKHALLVAVGTRYRGLRSSMLYALERKRESAIDFLNGEIVSLASNNKLSTPVNVAAISMIHRLWDGSDKPNRDHLYRLYRHTRQAAAA